MATKFLFYPVKPFRISQYFGEDRVCMNSNNPKDLINKETNQFCPVGYKSIYTATNGHNGLDIPANMWQPVYASHDGIVSEVQTEIERGLGIGIVSNNKFFIEETGTHEYVKTRYWHFISMDVNLGDKVKIGDFIGYADSTGRSTGPHVHLELKPVKIIGDLKGVPVVTNILQNNSHLGAINPLPYMDNISALEFAGLVRQVAEIVARVSDFISDRLRWGIR